MVNLNNLKPININSQLFAVGTIPYKIIKIQHNGKLVYTKQRNNIAVRCKHDRTDYFSSQNILQKFYTKQRIMYSRGFNGHNNTM